MRTTCLHPFLLALLLTALLAALLVGCGRNRRGGGGGGPDDGRTGTDAGAVDSSTLTPPAGELALTVESASWVGVRSERDVLEARIRLGNGEGGSPASLDPTLFSVRTLAGTEVLGGTELAAGDGCSADLAVSAGADRGCAVTFAIPSGEMPAEVIYRGSDGREAAAALPICSPAESAGLCAPHESCIEGSCGAGTCTRFELGDACIDCVTILSDTEGCDLSAEASCADSSCVTCPFDGTSDTCACAEGPACTGCEVSITEAWDCIALECPVCVP